MAPLPRSAVLRLLAAWLVVALVGALSVASQHGAAARPEVVAGALSALGLLVGLGARSGLYLAAARRGQVRLDDGAPPHRLWRLAPLSVVVGLLSAAPVAALGAFAALKGAPRTGLVVGAVCVTLLGFKASVHLVERDLARPVRPRRTSLTAWLLADTVLPAASAAAAVGAGIGWLRLGALDAVPPSELSRHLAVTLFLYAALLGPAGALKAGRERLAGLVEAPVPARSLPGPVVVGGTLGVLVLALGPRLLPAMAPGDVIVMKAVLGGLVGGGLCLLGAWRGARVTEAELRRR